MERNPFFGSTPLFITNTHASETERSALTTQALPTRQSHWPTKSLSQTRLGFMALNFSGVRLNFF